MSAKSANTVHAYKNRLKEILAARGMKQSELAKIAKMDRTRINQYVGNKQIFSVAMGLRLAKALNVPFETLIEGTEFINRSVDTSYRRDMQVASDKLWVLAQELESVAESLASVTAALVSVQAEVDQLRKAYTSTADESPADTPAHSDNRNKNSPSDQNC